ncbi:MAG TPA: putative glycoside hydrolase [Thermomicrobiales bacterium]|nr:putative glycoside hydrolase [Thermomicrobiales bacterium]
MVATFALNRRRGLSLLAGGLLAGGLSMATSAATSALQGFVTTDSGESLGNARVSDGVALALTDANGAFAFAEGQLQGDRPLRFSAPGYRDRILDRTEIADGMTVQLEPRDIRALYVNPSYTTMIDQYDAIIDLINATNANAVVLDIKEEFVWYDTSVEFFHDAGTVDPRYDLAKILARFRENNIYTIARLVVFKDSIVASVHPDLAIQHTITGEPWRDQNGVSWVNPLRRELWAPNIELAVEAAAAGFDEIQYDYIRFPTDGDLTTMDFGSELTMEVRQTTVEDFLALSREHLLPTGAKQAADLFGFTMVIDDDLGIGQNFARVAALLDYLCPMVYPSHYSDYQFGLPGHPNDYPYEVVDISLAGGVERVMGNSRQIRPWLQDFTYPGMYPYGPAEVRAQIQACVDHDTSGWMLWDPDQVFRSENLDQEDVGAVPNPENVIDDA